MLELPSAHLQRVGYVTQSKLTAAPAEVCRQVRRLSFERLRVLCRQHQQLPPARPTGRWAPGRQRSFREHTPERGFCAVGSLKSNIGHLDAAAGVAGLIKTVLALEHRQIPPSLHFESPNPEIDFERSPFYVSTACRPWDRRDGHPRRAAVNSFGIGGTNAHAILEQAPALPAAGPARDWQLLVLSAKDDVALERQASNLAAHLRERGAELALADVAYTLQVGRRQLEHRRAVLCRDAGEALAALEGGRPADVWSRRATSGAHPIVFMFPGQGAQYAGMGRGLYDTEPVYRQAVDGCLELLASELDLDLRPVLLPPPGAAEEPDAGQRLQDTAVAQPALFVVEVALAALWRSWGVEPEALIGHSVGELSAAAVSGVLEWRDALRLVALRGRLMSDMPRGVMLGVPMAEAELRRRLAGEDELWLSAVNAPELCTVSGTEARVGAFERELAAQGHDCRRLHTSHAFHSGMMEAAAARFADAMRQVALVEPKVPYLSNVTGRWITAAELRDPAYWGRHIRQPVRFAEGMACLLEDPHRALLEVGPGQVLGMLARQHGSCGQRPVVSSLPPPRSDRHDAAFLLGALGRLWTAGVSVSWDAVHDGERRRRVELPTYPFERQRLRVEPRSAPGADARPPARSLTRLRAIDDWFSMPVWRQTPPLPDPAAGAGRWLILGAEELAADRVRCALRAVGAEVEIVPAGSGSLEQRLRARAEDLPPRMVLAGHHAAPATLLGLARALAGLAGEPRREVLLAGSGLHAVTGDERPDPRAAALAAMARVMAQELAGVRCRTVDVCAGVADRVLAAELLAAGGPPTVALRAGRRWSLGYQPVKIGAAAGQRVAEGGKVYLITGGLGRIGLALAESFARDARVTLVLSSRTPLRDPAGSDPRRRRLRAIEALGAEVVVVPADLGEPAQAARLIREIDARCGRLDGVIHAAGVVGGSSLRAVAKLDAEACGAQLAPKLGGLAALDDALAERPLDFRVATSSLSTVVGGLDLGAYAAANAAMDAAAAASPNGWRTVALDGWAFDSDAAAAERSQALRLAMTPEEGVEATRRAIGAASGFAQLIVSTADVEARIERWVTAPPVDEPALPEVEKHARPSLSTPYVAAETPVQQALAEIWQELFGIRRIGIHDDFFDLGGHSLLATRLVAAVELRLGVELPLRAVFGATTVAAQEVEITRRLAERQDEEELARMIEEVEGMSQHELRSELPEAES